MIINDRSSYSKAIFVTLSAFPDGYPPYLDITKPKPDSIVFPSIRKAAVALGANTRTDGLSKSWPLFADSCFIAGTNAFTTKLFPTPASPAR